MNPYQAPNPQQVPPGYGYTPPSQEGYEFSPAENEVVGSTGTWCVVLGALLIFEAIGSFVSKLATSDGAGKALGAIIGAIVGVIIGVFFVQAGQSFRKVVTTQGNDVQHLVQALDAFGRALRIRIILFVIAAVFIVLGALIVMSALRAM